MDPSDQPPSATAPQAEEGVLLPIPDPAESARLLGQPDGVEPFRSGFVALIGRPNVGKSTLLNQLVGQKVAITSPIAQTTRNRLRAILTTPQAQLVLLDTPGIHKPHHLLGERLVKTARGAIGEVDVVLLLVDGSQPAGRGDGFIVELLRHCRAPVHVALNKHDLVSPERRQELAASYRELLAGGGQDADPGGPPPLDWPLHPVSALTGAGTSELVQALSAALPPGPHLYPADAVSDQPEQLLMAELIREQVLSHTREEVPHSVAVSIDRVVEDGPRTAVLATVLVERSSQKGILIGKGGRMLRTIGQGARLQMEKVFAGPVYLELFVKVVPGWRRSAARLAELGYRGD
ncbi:MULTISPECIES: GTPase Era [Aphanothece]|uniref:GTPase Era n=1 Tax=Aphanothece TaxID=1121 RepID=UPI00398466F1